jgi:hypothetical protein
MPKKPVSLTLEETNLLWLKGRARVIAGGSLSEAVDQLIDQARAGRLGAAEPPRSVVGTIDLPDDTMLAAAANEMRGLFDVSLARPIFVHDDRQGHAVSKKSTRKK